ncbi:MAG: hypothetical protein ABI970_04785 [Chloroflexota bacterium]
MTNVTRSSVYWELMEYLAKFASPQQVLEFKVSETMQERLEELFEKNNEGDITPEERLELDEFVEFDQHIMLLKAHAMAATEATPGALVLQSCRARLVRPVSGQVTPKGSHLGSSVFRCGPKRFGSVSLK